MEINFSSPVITPQGRLAFAWAVAQSRHARLSSVSDSLLDRCYYSTSALSVDEALELLEEVPNYV